MKRARGRKRTIAVVTGTRAEYGLLRSTMAAIRAHPRLDLQVVACGMHVLKKFGHTVRDIERDGFTIDARVRMQRGDDTPTDQAKGLGRGVSGIAEFLSASNADVVVVLGDRIEAMAGALAAVTTGKALAHIHGGDVAPGDFDDALRHAISKLAHLHLAATADAAKRLRRMNEEATRIHVVGAPGLDRIREILGAPDLSRSGGGALIVQHASGRPASRERAVMRTILETVRRAGLRRTIIYPNSDRGHSGVIEAIETHVRRSPTDDVRVFRSLERDAYLRALIAADVLLGNSSSGIIESALAGTPAVNIGDRQRGRLASGRTVVHAGERSDAIRRALSSALGMRVRRPGPSIYGDGRAGEKIAEILARITLGPELLEKSPTP